MSPGLTGVIFSVGIISGFRGDPGAQWHGWFLFFIFFQNVSPMSPWMEDQRYFPGCKGEGCAPFGALTRGGPSPRSFPQPPFHLVLPTSGSNEEAPHSYSQQLWVNLGPPGRRAGGAVFPRLGSEVRQKPLGSQGESGVMAKVRFHFCTHSYPSLASAATEQVRKAPLSCLCCSVWHRRSSWDLMAHGEEPPGHPQGPPVLSASPLPVNDLVEPQQHHQLLPRQ